MARDEGLEEQVREALQDLRGLSEKRMFGGMAWLLQGNLLCGASDRGLMVRLGRGGDGWALAEEGVGPMMSGTRRMTGWVRASPEACADDRLFQRLLREAVACVRGLRRDGA